MDKYSLIIWDYNGTLIDDVDAALGAVNDMLIKRNQHTIDLRKYRSAVDIPIWKFYETIFEADTITQEEAIEEFDIGYEKHLKKDPLMEGVQDVIEYFRSQNAKQIVLSASHVDKVKNRLTSLGVISFFDAVLGRSDNNVGDKTYLAKRFFADNNINPNEVLIIGDCVNDYHVSQSLNCHCVLHTRGHHSRLEMNNTSARIIDSLYELIN